MLSTYSIAVLLPQTMRGFPPAGVSTRSNCVHTEPTIWDAPYMLLATSHGVPSMMMCWSLPQRFADAGVLADTTAVFGVAGVFVGSGVFAGAGVFTGTGVVVDVELFAATGIMAPELAPRFWHGEEPTDAISAKHATAFAMFTTAMEKSKERQSWESEMKKYKKQKIVSERSMMGGLERQEVQDRRGKV